MDRDDRLPVSVFPLVVLLIAFFLAATPSAVSAYQPETSISSGDFDNASANIHIRVESNGRITANTSFHAVKRTQSLPASFAQVPLKSGELEIRAEQTGSDCAVVNVDVQLILVENRLGVKAKTGLTYLSNMTVEDINERFAPKIKSLYSKFQEMSKAQMGEKAQNVTENITLPELENFRITSFSWSSPQIEVSIEAEFAHPHGGKLDLPIDLTASVAVEKRSIEIDASFSATPKGPGLENASLSFSISRREDLGVLNVSATADGKMPKKDNAYIANLSRYTKNMGEKELSRLENVKLPENISITVELEVSKGLRVENQPSTPSYCKYCGTDKPRVYVWENEDAVTAKTSLLSGESSFAVKPVPEKEPQAGVPYTYLAVAVAVGALAVAGVSYWMRVRTEDEE